MKKNNGVIYVRVSSDKQVQGTSLDSQEKACKKYCKDNDIQISGVFRDEGESAKSANRPEFLNAIDFCLDKKNQVSTFLVWKIDRFARNTADHALVKAKLKEGGVNLNSVTEPIGGEEAVDELMETILSGFAQFDNDIRKQRAINGMSEKIKAGIVPYNAPVGYVSPQCGKRGEKKNIPDTPHPDIFPILRQGLLEFSEGHMTKADLGRRFVELGLKNHAPYICGKQGIQKFLTEERVNFYAGKIWNPFENKYYDGIHERMITLKERDKILDALHNRTKKQAGKLKNELFPLRGILLCEDCDHTLTASSPRGRKKRYHYYHCHNRSCNSYGKTKNMSNDIVAKKFMARIKDISASETKIRLFEAFLRKEYSNRHKDKEKSRQRIFRLITVLKNKRDRIFEMREDGSYSKEEFQERKLEIEEQLDLHEKQLHELVEDDSKLDMYLEQSLDYLNNLDLLWKDMTLENKIRFQQLVFPDKIYYKKEGPLGTASCGYLVSLFSDFAVNNNLVVAEKRLSPNFALCLWRIVWN